MLGAKIDGVVYGDTNIVAVKALEREIAHKFSLLQNYPNPFNPSTTISYDLPASGHVTAKIYDLTGRLVQVIANADQAAGSHQILWDGTDFQDKPVAAGVYICRVEFASGNGQKKVKNIKLSLLR